MEDKSLNRQHDDGGPFNGDRHARDNGVDRGGEAVGHAKFDLGSPGSQLPVDQIPWAYGENRVTAMARDPEWVYVYWEIMDESIADARAKLGQGGQEAWCCLRVYDTTDRIFDGTNANDYFDIAIDRRAREWFVHVGRPSSVQHVEIGMKSREGYFQMIARSGRAELPRKSPSRDMTVEWMTVQADNRPEVNPLARPYTSRFFGPEPVIPIRLGGLSGVSAGVPQPASTAANSESIASWTSTWTESRAGGWSAWWEQRYETHYARLAIPWLSTVWRTDWQGEYRAFQWFGPRHSIAWVGPVESYSWVAGPYPVDISTTQERIEVRHWGGYELFAMDGGRHVVVHGPWQIIIHGFEASSSGLQRRVLGTWLIHWVRPTIPVIERWENSPLRHWMETVTWHHFVAGASEQLLWSERGASELWMLGASERMWLGASELLLLGGSEIPWLGASQLEWLGASQWVYAGASEVFLGGASERRELGASEVLYAGASEQLSLGASEVWLGGASEVLLGGASEVQIGGASEWFGASELLVGGASEWLGASELLVGGASEWLGASELLGASESLGESEAAVTEPSRRLPSSIEPGDDGFDGEES